MSTPLLAEETSTKVQVSLTCRFAEIVSPSEPVCIHVESSDASGDERMSYGYTEMLGSSESYVRQCKRVFILLHRFETSQHFRFIVFRGLNRGKFGEVQVRLSELVSGFEVTRTMAGTSTPATISFTTMEIDDAHPLSASRAIRGGIGDVHEDHGHLGWSVPDDSNVAVAPTGMFAASLAATLAGRASGPAAGKAPQAESQASLLPEKRQSRRRIVGPGEASDFSRVRSSPSQGPSCAVTVVSAMLRDTGKRHNLIQSAPSPFVIIKHLGVEMGRTEKVGNTFNPEFRQQGTFKWALQDDFVDILVFDHHKTRKSKLLATGTLDLRTVEKKGTRAVEVYSNGEVMGTVVVDVDVRRPSTGLDGGPTVSAAAAAASTHASPQQPSPAVASAAGGPSGSSLGATTPAPPKRYIQAMHSFQSTSPNVLSFNVGEQFAAVGEPDPAGWQEVEVATGQRAFVPSGYFTPVATSRPPAPPFDAASPAAAPQAPAASADAFRTDTLIDLSYNPPPQQHQQQAPRAQPSLAELFAPVGPFAPVAQPTVQAPWIDNNPFGAAEAAAPAAPPTIEALPFPLPVPSNNGGYTIYDNPYSALAYMRGGTKISLAVAIDYTVSNGSPSAPSSLHYVGNGPSEYIDAMRAVGDILADYSSGGRTFPAFGFGGNVNPSKTVSHCFACNGNEADPFCSGVDGLVQAYLDSFQRISLSAPTNFSDVIIRTTQLAMDPANTDTYYVLLIITDGELTEGGDALFLTKTIDAIVAASHAPLSIVIVGVGKEDFSRMHVLDSPSSPLMSSSGDLAARDIVQFVPFREFHNRRQDLASAVLTNLPHQLLTYKAMYQQHPGHVRNPPPPKAADARAAALLQAALRGSLRREEEAAPPPRRRFTNYDARTAAALEQMEGMGFTDEGRNVAALRATNNDVNAAVERLLAQ